MKPRHHGLDAVTPTATAALDGRRQAQRTLREIDALLAGDEPVSTASSRTKSRAREAPGSGSYDPQKERTQWRHGAAVKLYRGTPASTKKTAVVRCEHARAAKTPGPGAYDVASADRIVKRRVTSASFTSTRQDKATQREEPPPRKLEPARADKWLSRFLAVKGAVAYRPSTAAAFAAQGQSREQRQKLRRIKLEKTRHARVGFYNVRFGLTERRLGSKGILLMGKSPQGESARHFKARVSRRVRALRSSESSSKVADQKEASVVAGATKTRSARTIQWQRARARTLLRPQTVPHRDENPNNNTRAGRSQGSDLGLPTRLLRRDLAAHAMAKQSGRDTVRCRLKNRLVSIRFDAPPKKEAKQHAYEPPTHGERSKPSAAVVYARMLGRNDTTIDPHGVYLVGRERDSDDTSARLWYDPNDRAIRPRVPTTTIRASDSPRHDAGRRELVLSPKFTLVDRRTKGHAFLRFENQLDRRGALAPSPRSLRWARKPMKEMSCQEKPHGRRRSSSFQAEGS